MPLYCPATCPGDCCPAAAACCTAGAPASPRDWPCSVVAAAAVHCWAAAGTGFRTPHCSAGRCLGRSGSGCFDCLRVGEEMGEQTFNQSIQSGQSIAGQENILTSQRVTTRRKPSVYSQTVIHFMYSLSRWFWCIIFKLFCIIGSPLSCVKCLLLLSAAACAAAAAAAAAYIPGVLYSC